MTQAMKLPLTVEDIIPERLTLALPPCAPGIEVHKLAVLK